MNFFLPLISVFLFFVLFFLTSPRKGLFSDTRTSFILSLIANGIVVFIYNESFSFFDAINSTSALLFWLVEVIGLSGLLVYWNTTGRISFARLSDDLRNVVQLRGLSKSNKTMIFIALIFFILPLLFLAVYPPPNNFDAHSYHLNRILFWVSNGNLDHFPTQHIQQLYLNVFAEYLVLHSVLLSGSDAYAGLVQFGAFIGSLAGISLLAKKVGMKADGQLLAAAFLLTLPIGIFESTSAQVDYVACFFFISYVYFGFELLGKRSAVTLIAFLLSLSFGGSSKYTVFIFGIPFTIYFAVRILAQYGIVYSAKVLTLALVLMVVTFGSFFYRNYALFGNVMSPPQDSRFFSEKIPIDEHSLAFAASGIVKNVGLHLGLPNNGFNQFLDTKIRNFHDWLGVDVNDLRLRLDPFSVRYSVHEDMMPNTIHLWLIALACLPLFFLKNRWKVKWLWICAFTGFILFCTMMKFQLWSSRTHMPFFAMGGILVAYIYCEVLKWKIPYLMIPLLLVSSVFVYGNPNKSLIPLGYFTKKALGHIPVAICAADSVQEEVFKKALSAYYVFPGKDRCHPIKNWPAYVQRAEIFGILENLGYYDDDKSSTVFTTDREKGYFLSHLDNYYSVKPLLDHVEGEGKNVGILFRKELGFYNYWSALATRKKNPGMMEYIYYKKEFMVLKNAQKDFCYDYILGDDPELLKGFIPADNIEAIYHAPLFYLVKLKKTSCDRKLF